MHAAAGTHLQDAVHPIPILDQPSLMLLAISKLINLSFIAILKFDNVICYNINYDYVFKVCFVGLIHFYEVRNTIRNKGSYC